MKIEEIEKQLETKDRIEFSGVCHDCGAPVNISCAINENGELIISGGAMYNPKFGVPPIEHIFFKCDECFNEDRVLRNWNPCSVYSRVVGYLRPIEGWNVGKQEEWKMRKNFKIEV